MSIVLQIILGIFLTIGMFLFNSESEKYTRIGFFILSAVIVFLVSYSIVTGPIG